MKKRILMISSLLLFIMFAFVASAAVLAVPASDVARGGFPVIDANGAINKDLVKVDFVYYAKPDGVGKPSKLSLGYKLMGVKWLVQEDYYVNLSNTTLSTQAAASAIEASVAEWDRYTDCIKTTGLDLFGNVNYSNTVHYGVYDNINAIEFGDYSDPNVIAITSTWYSKSTKSILEYDILFNNGDFNWSVDANGSSNAMDLQNIATHELGHAIGLADIYKSNFNYVTMYGYSSNGDIQKRTLADPDIMGLQSMYGGLVN